VVRSVYVRLGLIRLGYYRLGQVSQVRPIYDWLAYVRPV